MRKMNFSEVPSSRLPLTFQWLELGHGATTGSKGAREPRALYKIKSPRGSRRGENGWGKAANSRGHYTLDSIGNECMLQKVHFLGNTDSCEHQNVCQSFDMAPVGADMVFETI